MMNKRTEMLKKSVLLLAAGVLAIGGLVAVGGSASAAYAQNPPTGLRQVDKTGTSINVGWNATSGANLYYVRYSTSSSMSGSKYLSSTSTTKNITGLQPSTWYYIQVRSAKGTPAKHTLLSAYSSTVNIRTTEFTFDPPSSFSVDFTRKNSADLSWKFVNNADSYSLEIKGGSPSTTRYVRVKDTDTLRTISYTAEGLQSQQNYSFRVRALEQKVDPTADPNGSSFGYYELTDWTSSKSTTTPATNPPEPPQPATNLRATSIDRTSITLAWDPVVGAARYRVFWTTDASPPSRCEPGCHVITPTNASAPSDTITGLSPGTDYYILVSAINASGSLITGYQKRPLNVQTLTTAPGPVVQVPYASATGIKMDWPDVAGATKYEAKMSASQSMSSPMTKTNLATSDATWTGLTANKLYFVQVRAYLSDNTWGDWSSVAGAHTRDVYGAISGRVNDVESGSAQATYAWAYDTSGQLAGGDRVRPDGTYTIFGLTPGSYRVLLDQLGGFNVTSPWVSNSSSSGALYRSQATAYSVSTSLVTLPTITPPVGMRISGEITGTLCKGATRVTALSDNTSVSGAKDAVMGDVSTAADGTYEIVGLPKGESFWLRFGSTSCGTKSVHVDGSTTDVTGVNTSFETTGGGDTIPASVEGLKATNVTSSGATISWNAVPTAVKYRVYWSPSSSMSSSCEPRCHVIDATTSVPLSSFLSGNSSGGNTTPTGGTTYYLKISAINSAGKTITGWQSTPLTVTLPPTSGGGTIPSSVEGLQATNVTSSGATISWDAVPTAVKYRVYWSPSSSMSSSCEPRCHVVNATTSMPLSSFLSGNPSGGNATPTGGNSYYLKISAINSAGKTITGWQSTPLTVTLPPPAGGATIPSSVEGIAADDITFEGARVSWDPVPTAMEYRVYWSTSSSMSSRCEPNCHKVTATTQTLAQILDPSNVSKRAYYFKVSAINSSGKTITGWQSSPYKIDLPAATVDLGATTAISTTDATINWTPLTAADSYRVYWSTAPTCRAPANPRAT